MLINTIYLQSTVTSVEYKFNLGEIRKASIVEKEISKPSIWSTTIFWVYDGMMCVKDIVRFSNMSIKEAAID